MLGGPPAPCSAIDGGRRILRKQPKNPMFSEARGFDGLADGIASREKIFTEQIQSVMRAGNNRVGVDVSGN